MLRHSVLLSRARLVSPSWRLPLVCLVALVAATGCRGRESAGQPGSGAATVDVVTARATREPVTRLLRVTGSLIADEEAEVAAETGGRVVETPVERGTRVTEGSPLMRIVATEAEASAQEAEANVAQIEVRLGLGGDQALDVEKVSEVANARAAWELAEAEFGRARKLHDDRVISGSEFDQRRTHLEVTRRQYDTAQNTARQLYRQLEAARARLKLARKALADTVVRAPFAGVVVERKVSIGDFVTRGTKVVTVVKTNPLRVELTVPEQSVSAVKPGQSLELEVDAYPGRKFAGQVRYISPSLRTDQRALTIEAIVPNPDGVLKPGLFAAAAVQEPGKERALFVPSAAIRNLEGSNRVYVVKGERVEERMVTIGQVVGQNTEIVNGIAEGDEVARTNLDRLADGTRVRVTAPAAGRIAEEAAPGLSSR